MLMIPLLPVELLPELNTNMPLLPPLPPFALRITTPPLVVAVPSPEDKDNAPPDLEVDLPPCALSVPPDPLVPLPTVTRIPPLRPAVAMPLPILMEPLLPVELTPELNTSMPLLPAAPLFIDRITTSPDDVAVPSPELRVSTPPECNVERPP